MSSLLSVVQSARCGVSYTLRNSLYLSLTNLNPNELSSISLLQSRGQGFTMPSFNVSGFQLLPDGIEHEPKAEELLHVIQHATQAHMNMAHLNDRDAILKVDNDSAASASQLRQKDADVLPLKVTFAGAGMIRAIQVLKFIRVIRTILLVSTPSSLFSNLFVACMTPVICIINPR